MKKIFSILFISGLLFAACNPMDDIYDEIDAKAITNKKNIDLTLSASDYESMGGAAKTNHYFTEKTLPVNYIPEFLAGKYPTFTEGSSVKVTYNYKNEANYLSAYTDASKYTLKSTDYLSVSATVGSAGYFSPKNPAANYLSAILSKSVSGATNGSVCIVSYKYSDVDPVEKEFQDSTVFKQAFTTDLGVFNAISVTGAQTWSFSKYNLDTYAKISGYSGGNKDNEDWLISPQIDLAGYSSATVNFTQAAKFVNSQWTQLSILVSSNYDGVNPSAATWTQLTVPTLPTGNDYVFVNSGNIDISSFDGKKIYVAFRYVSSTTNAATWEIKDVEVKGKKAVNKSAIITDPITLDELYTYNSGWKKTVGAYYLTSLDYDAMGENSDEPGKYNNFSSSILPANYLPQLAKIKYPYGQEKDTIIFVYKYFDASVTPSVTRTKADKLFFADNAWKMVIEKTDQYILSSAGWVFDPTVNYTMLSADYQLIVDYVKANIGASYVSSYGNNEYYYGANAFYTEFQIGPTYYKADKFASWEDAAKEAIGKAFLPAKYPAAVTQVDGINIFYKITFATYLSGTMTNYTITFQCTKNGPNPAFTYVEGPTKN